MRQIAHQWSTVGTYRAIGSGGDMARNLLSPCIGTKVACKIVTKFACSMVASLVCSWCRGTTAGHNAPPIGATKGYPMVKKANPDASAMMDAFLASGRQVQKVAPKATGKGKPRIPKEEIPGFYWESVTIDGTDDYLQVAPYCRFLDGEGQRPKDLDDDGNARYERQRGTDLPLWIGVSERIGPGADFDGRMNRYTPFELVSSMRDECALAAAKVAHAVAAKVK